MKSASQASSSSQSLRPRPSRSHCSVTTSAAKDLQDFGINVSTRQILHHAITHGDIVRVQMGRRLPDSQFGDHSFPSLVRQVTSEIEHKGTRIILRGDTVIAANAARQSTTPVVRSSSEAASSSASGSNAKMNPKSGSHSKSNSHKPTVGMQELARSMLLRESGSRVAARDGGIRMKLAGGQAAYKLSADKQVQQLQSRLNQLLDDGKFRHSSAAFRTQLMHGVEADWLKLVDYEHHRDHQQFFGQSCQQLVDALRCIAEQSVDKADDRQVIVEAEQVLKRIQKKGVPTKAKAVSSKLDK